MINFVGYHLIVTAIRSVLAFPDPVNEVAARLVAGVVVGLTLLYLSTGSGLLLAFIAYGFVARVATGPRLSPVGFVVTTMLVPRLPLAPRPTPGPPKRFAQGIGAILSVGALAAHLSGSPAAATLLVAAITVAASLEAFVGVCVGCLIFARLMKLGLVPQAVCEACADLRLRTGG